MTRTMTQAERELDAALAKNGLAYVGDGPDPVQASGNPDADEQQDDPTQGEPDASEQQDADVQEDHEDQPTGDPQPDQDADPVQAKADEPKHNWEKRAKDNQAAYMREKALREKQARQYADDLAKLTAQLAKFRSAEPSEEDQQFAEGHPEIAEYFNKKLKANQEREVDAVYEQMQSAFQRELTSLDKDWLTLVKDPKFQAWKDTQPRSTRDVLENTFRLGDDGAFFYEPADVAVALDKFRATQKGYTPSEPSEGQQRTPRSHSNTPGDSTRPDVFSLEEMNDTNLADKFMRKQKDRRKAGQQFDVKYHRSIKYWRSKGYEASA